MDLLKAQFARLTQQFAALSASQRMLAATLIVIMGMTLFYWTHYAGEAEMVPLLNQSFSQSDMSQITARLAAKNISYSISGDRILVPADRNIEVLADLGFAHLLPMKTDEGFDDIIAKMSPWDSQSKTSQMWLEAKNRTLAAVIEGFPGVGSATVMIDQSDERRFDGEDVTPTAMVSIVTDSGSQDMNLRELATAAADVISGANAGLSRGKVAVTINGITYPVNDVDDADGAMPGDDVIAQMGAAEKHYREQIVDELGFIHGLMVSVRVDLNTQRTETDAITYDSKTAVHQTLSDETETNTTQGGSSGAEPGVDPNTQANAPISVGGAPAGGGGGASSDIETEKVAYENHIPETREHTVKGPGDAEAVSASVRVPRSYFVDAYKSQSKGAEPTDDQLSGFMTTEMSRIRDEVKNSTGIKDDTAVSVNWYADDIAGLVPASAEASASALGVTSLLKVHGKEFGVAGLALVSLFMMMMMVRKSVPVVLPVVSATPSSPPPLLKTDSPLVGEVGESGQSFDGMELDEESVKTQQMVEQVSNMVNENPDGAASLVKRWLNRG